MAELMGGEIGVESELGRGSTFWFTVRLGSTTRGEPSWPSAAPAHSTGFTSIRPHHAVAAMPSGERPSHSVRILVADDHEMNQIVAAEVLTRSGFLCDVVSNGHAAVEAVLSGRYDVVLMDCQMPEMDGFEATRAIRRSEMDHKLGRTGPSIPIIALTASAIKGDRESLEAGMDGYASKPINPAELVETIDALVSTHTHRRERDSL